MSAAGFLPLAGAALAILALIALSAWLGFAGKPVLDGLAEAEIIADSLPGGFASIDGILDRDGHGALLADGTGRIALVVPSGAHFIARLAGSGLEMHRDGSELVLRGAGVLARFALDDEAGRWEAVLREAIEQA